SLQSSSTLFPYTTLFRSVPEEINTFYISSEELKVPYWFMNYDDFDFLFQPSELTQAPILKRSIALAKDNASAGTQMEFLSIPVRSEEHTSELQSRENLVC